MDTTLLIMAAGIGSRFGGGIKQLAAVDDHRHIIMDYSIHDAIAAGFNHIVFVLRLDIEADFREVIGDRVEAVCRPLGVTVDYAFQSLEDISVPVPEGRRKPWGTGQAVLCARRLLNGPFAVLNADDYYGKAAFVRLHDFLCQPRDGMALCMAGFVLKNTLSENGGVTRGVCQVKDGLLTDVVETREIVCRDGWVGSGDTAIDPDAWVSMNMWGLSPEFVDVLGEGFERFLREAVPADPLKAEFLLPTFIGALLREGRVSVRVLPTPDRWFGVTYREDQAAVTASFRQLIADGVYREDLYADL